MALPALTYERYTQLGGTLPEDGFKASLRAAQAAVREAVGFNEPEGPEQTEAYERAVAAAVDVDAYYGASGGVGEAAASMTLGKFSISGLSDGGTSAYDLDMRRAIRRELSGSGLLFQGIC